MKKFFKSLFCILMLCVAGLGVQACDSTTVAFSMTENDFYKDGKIVLNLSEGAKSFTLQTSGDTLNYEFAVDSFLASVSVKYLYGGEASLSITPIALGTSTLHIVATNGDALHIPIEITDTLSAIKFINPVNYCVLDGENIYNNILTKELLDFYPASKSRLDVKFKVGGEIKNKLDKDDFNNKEVEVVASCQENGKEVIAKTTYYLLNAVTPVLWANAENEAGKIEIIKNDSTLYKQEFSLKVASVEDFILSVQELDSEGKQTDNKLLTVVCGSQTKSDGNSTFSVVVQALSTQVGVGKLKLVLQYADYIETGYKSELTKDFVVMDKPKGLLINNNTADENGASGVEITVLKNGTMATAQPIRLSVFPSGASYFEYKLEIDKPADSKIYLCNSNGENVEKFDNDGTGNTEFLLYVYGGSESETQTKITVKLSPLLAGSEVINENSFLVNVKPGTDVFSLDETKVVDGKKIFIEKGTFGTFSGFNVTEGAYIGPMLMTCALQKSGIVSLSQDDLSKPDITIVANSVGEVMYTLTLTNGLSVELVIYVVEPVSSDYIYLDLVNCDEQVIYKSSEIMTSSDEIMTSPEDNVIYIELKEKPETSVNGIKLFYAQDLVLYQKTENNITTFGEIENITWDENNAILKFTSDFNKYNEVITLTFSTTPYKMNNFILEALSPQIIEINLYVFAGIETAEMKDSEDRQQVTLYRQETVGKDDRTYSYYSDINVSAIDVNNSVISDNTITKIQWQFATSSVGARYSLGTAYWDSTQTCWYNTNENITATSLPFNSNGAFVGDEKPFITLSCLKLEGGSISWRLSYIYEEENNYEQIYLFATITREYGDDSLTNKVEKKYPLSMRLNIKDYVYVDNIYFKNYVKEIYLDATQTSAILFHITSPAEATDDSITAYLETTDGANLVSLISVHVEDDYIMLNYNAEGVGKGYLVVEPRLGPDTLSVAKRIPIIVADGSESYPLRITSAEELQNIDVSKHYQLLNTINLAGVHWTPLGELTGSIQGRGEGQIIGLTIDNTIKMVDGTYAGGLFSSIGKGGNVKGLHLEGTINISLANAKENDVFNIGLLCGKNSGEITNVTAVLGGSEVDLNSTKKTANIGGLVGQNCSNLSMDCKPEQYENNPYNKHFSTFVQMKDIFELSNKHDNATVYMGGVVGGNTGNIIFDLDKTLPKYNNFGLTAIINIVGPATAMGGLAGTSTAMGGLAGTSSGQIKGTSEGTNICFMIMEGDVDNTAIGGSAGGVVGTLTGGNIQYVKSRVYVTSSKGYTAGIAGSGTAGTINNCWVEATLTREKGTGAILLTVTDGGSVSSFCTSSDVAVGDNVAYTYFQDYGCCNIKEGETAGSLFSYLSATPLSEKSKALAYYYEAEDNILLDELGEGQIYTQDILNQSYNDISLVSLNYNLENVNLSSRNTNVVKINNNGNLQICGVGTAIIDVVSKLNYNKSSTITLYVTGAFDNYQLFANADHYSGSQVKSGTRITKYENQPLTLYVDLSQKIVESDGHNRIAIKKNNDTRINVDCTISSTGEAVGTTLNDDLYRLIILGTNVSDWTKMYIDNLKFAPLLVVEALLVEDRVNISFHESYTISGIVITHKQGATALNINKEYIEKMPDSSATVTLTLETYVAEDKLKLYVNDIEYTESYPNLTIEEVFTETVANIKTFKYNIELKDSTALGEYIIKFVPSSNTNISKSLTLVYKQQVLTALTIHAFEMPGDSTEYEADGVDIETISAGEKGYLRISATPAYANYSYIDVLNDVSNMSSNTFALFNAIGIADNYWTSINNGLRIYKPSTNPNYYFLSFIVASNLITTRSMTVWVNAYDNNNLLTISQRFDLVIKQRNDVVVNIVDRDQDIVTLAKGKSYLLDVESIKYSGSEIVVMAVNDTNNDLTPNAVIERTMNGEYLITIPQNAQSGPIRILSYGNRAGENVVFTYKEVSIKDFALPEDKLSCTDSDLDILIGSTVNLAEVILDDLNVEYNATIPSVEESFANFKKAIAERCVVNILYNDGTGYTSVAILDENRTSYNNQYFQIDYVDDNWQITTKRILPSSFYRIELSTYILNDAIEYSVVVNDGSLQTITKDFEIYQNSSISNVIPISTLDEFLNMQEGGYYILTNDINFNSSEISPLIAKFAYLDGNSHNILLKSIWANDISNVGLFAEIPEGTVVKNLNIYLISSLTINIRNISQSTVYVGALAGTNKGTITNCAVMIPNASTNYTQKLVVKYQESTVGETVNYTGGLVGLNTGFITNSRVWANIESNTNLAGFVGINNGHVSACAVQYSNIYNSSPAVNIGRKTSGFVDTNTGNILSSLVSGTSRLGFIFSLNENKRVDGMVDANAFARANSGEICDSYADIWVISNQDSSGFIWSNTGSIKRCWTVSYLGSGNASAYPFYYSDYNIAAENNRGIADSYFLARTGVANNSLNTNATGLTSQQFADQTIWETFSIAASNSNNKDNYLWFFPSRTESQFNYYDEALFFTIGRPELASANIIATPRKTQAPGSPIYDEATGEYTYFYIDSLGFEEGSKYNPILISNAMEIEELFARSDNCYYRLLCDVDYDKSNIVLSNLYASTFTGVLEGNGFVISNYAIQVTSVSTAVGFFKQVGKVGSSGTIKNVTFQPKNVIAPNGYCVGIVCGMLENGKLINVTASTLSLTSSDFVLIGKYVVGGLVGRAKDNSLIFGGISEFSVRATYITSSVLLSELYSSITDGFSLISYAGGLVGVLGNNSVLNFGSLGDRVIVNGKVAGMFAGGVASGTIRNINYSVKATQGLNAYTFGGIIVGHIEGNAIVEKTNVTGLARNDFFIVVPVPAVALGGIAGVLTSGMVNTCQVNVSLIAPKVEIVGGLIGMLAGLGTTDAHSNIEVLVDSCIAGDEVEILSAKTAGGLIGFVGSFHTYNGGRCVESIGEGRYINVENSYADIKKVGVDNSATYLHNEDERISAYVGGYFGKVQSLNNATSNFVFQLSLSEGLPLPEIISVNIITVKAPTDIYMGGLVGHSSDFAEIATSSEPISGEVSGDYNILFDYNINSYGFGLTHLVNGDTSISENWIGCFD